MNKNQDYYKSLKSKLDETTKFPAKYLYKFIVPTGGAQVKKIEDIFNFGSAVITTKLSKTGKFTSVSILIMMESSDAIISKYEEIGTIKGVISL